MLNNLRKIQFLNHTRITFITVVYLLVECICISKCQTNFDGKSSLADFKYFKSFQVWGWYTYLFHLWFILKVFLFAQQNYKRTFHCLHPENFMGALIYWRFFDITATHNRSHVMLVCKINTYQYFYVYIIPLTFLIFMYLFVVCFNLTDVRTLI